MTEQKFPDEGELFKSRHKKFQEVVFFVHFYNGHKKALIRHIRFMNQLGYDAYAFNIQFKLKDHQYLPYSETSQKLGLKHGIAEQIRQHLDIVTNSLNYTQIHMFAFSNIAACAIEAMAYHPNREQLFSSLICDSGPSYEFVKSAYNLYTHSEPIRWPLRMIAAPIFSRIWSPELNNDTPQHLDKMKEGFPVLSIRGWKDKLISPKDIDQIFQPCQKIHWQKLSLPEAEHLTGLRDFSQDYKPVVEEFLKNHSATLAATKTAID